MRVGRLNRQITIERKVITGVSPSNEPIYAWQTFRAVWSEVYSVRAQEQWSEEDSRRIAETTTRFRIHYNDALGIDSTMRIVFEGAAYDIQSILADHVRKLQATIDATAQGVSVAGAPLDLYADVNETGTVDEVYQAIIHIFGGVAPYAAELTGGSPVYTLPPGLTLVQVSETSWGIEGFPTTPGSYPISVTVTDAAENATTLDSFVLTILSDGSP